MIFNTCICNYPLCGSNCSSYLYTKQEIIEYAKDLFKLNSKSGIVPELLKDLAPTALILITLGIIFCSSTFATFIFIAILCMKDYLKYKSELEQNHQYTFNGDDELENLHQTPYNSSIRMVFDDSKGLNLWKGVILCTIIMTFVFATAFLLHRVYAG
jgi:hypothetical protein